MKSKLEEVLDIIQKEPNYETFEYKGFKCRIWRHPEFLTLNGYVGLVKGHSYYKKGYDDIFDIECHGGFTFSGFWPYADRDDHSEPDGLWYIGFDTAHYQDFNPGIFARLPKDMQIRHDSTFDGETYKDINYVRNECRSIVDQLRK